MKKNQNRPETGKIRRLLAAALSVMMLATSGFTTAWADTPEVTKNHYPSSARVGKTEYWAGDAPRLFWMAPYETPASTSIYMWNGTTWTDFSDEKKDIGNSSGYMAFIPDGNTNINALYKIVNTFADGVKTEYIIQKNDSGENFQQYNGERWQGYKDTGFAGVTGADAHSGRLSLKMSNWSARWHWNSMLTIPMRTGFDKTKSYKVSFWYKSNGNSGAPAFFVGYGPLKGEKTLDWKQKVITRIVDADGNVKFSEDNSWAVDKIDNTDYGFISFTCNERHQADDFWVDDIEIYELDKDGNEIGSNLLPNGDFEYQWNWDKLIDDGVANVTYDGIDGGVILKWQKEQAGDSIGTRVYNEDGHLIAELGSATELPLTSLENGKEYTYELRNVTTGGYECAGNRITVTAGVPTVKPAITDYHPINLTAKSDIVPSGYTRIMWVNPYLNGIELTGVKFYDISEGTPVEKNICLYPDSYTDRKIDNEAVYLEEGRINSVLLPKNATKLNDTLYRVDFTYSDGTTVSLATSEYGNISENSYWSLGTIMRQVERTGIDHTESASGKSSMLIYAMRDLNHYIPEDWMNHYIDYVGDKSKLETGKNYQISLKYKTLLDKDHKWFRDKTATATFFGYETKLPLNDTYDWTEKTWTVTNATNTNISFTPNFRAALWIDDVSVRLLDENGNPTGDNLIENGDFEGASEASTIADVAYVRTDDGITVTWTRTKGNRTNVYLDGVKIAEVSMAEAKLPITGLEAGKEHTVVLKEVYNTGVECDGVTLNIVNKLTVSGFDIYDKGTDETVDTIGGDYPAYDIRANINNAGNTAKTLMIAYAMYDADGNLLLVNSTCQTIDAGVNTPISVSYEYESEDDSETLLPSDISYAKIFLWDMTENMKPLELSKKLNRQDW